MKCVPYKYRMFAKHLQFIVYLLQTEELYFQSRQVIMKCHYFFSAVSRKSCFRLTSDR